MSMFVDYEPSTETGTAFAGDSWGAFSERGPFDIRAVGAPGGTKDADKGGRSEEDTGGIVPLAALMIGAMFPLSGMGKPASLGSGARVRGGEDILGSFEPGLPIVRGLRGSGGGGDSGPGPPMGTRPCWTGERSGPERGVAEGLPGGSARPFRCGDPNGV